MARDIDIFFTLIHLPHVVRGTTAFPINFVHDRAPVVDGLLDLLLWEFVPQSRPELHCLADCCRLRSCHLVLHVDFLEDALIQRVEIRRVWGDTVWVHEVSGFVFVLLGCPAHHRDRRSRIFEDVTTLDEALVAIACDDSALGALHKWHDVIFDIRTHFAWADFPYEFHKFPRFFRKIENFRKSKNFRTSFGKKDELVRTHFELSAGVSLMTPTAFIRGTYTVSPTASRGGFALERAACAVGASC